jgi:hypothetical protein
MSRFRIHHPEADQPGVARTEAQWDQYYTDLERRKIAAAREADALRARWDANSRAYFQRRDQLLKQAAGAR